MNNNNVLLENVRHNDNVLFENVRHGGMPRLFVGGRPDAGGLRS